MIPKEDIEAIREKVDLVELVKDSDIVLSPSGRNWKGLCPFPSHDERTPSFTVSPETNRYICYGCGMNGDAFDFLRETQGMTFIESVETLANRVDYKITHIDTNLPKKTDAPLAEINAAARDFFVSQSNAQVTEFFKERGLDEDMLRKEWGVGYSTPGKLKTYLVEQGFSEKHIIEAGLLKKSERNGSTYEAFRGRLMWTIYDHLNRAVGFGARKLYENDPLPGKFVNTSATEIYKKNDVLFGLNKARQGIRKDSVAILCEGYTDVVVFHMSEMPYAVASCGTAITENHTRRLARLLGENGELVVAMDGDQAGIKAATKVLDLASGYPLIMSCILLPGGMDPEEYRRKNGEEALKKEFDNRQPLVETLLTHTMAQYDLTSPEGVSQATVACSEVLSNVHNPVLSEQYERWLALRLKVSPQHVASSYTEKKSPRKPKITEAQRNVEFDVLRMAYQKPAIFMEYIEAIGNNPDLFQQETTKDAIEELLWLDPDVDESEWRESMTFAMPNIEDQIKAGLPFSVIENDHVAAQFMGELISRLDVDRINRNKKIELETEIFENAMNAADILNRLAHKNGETK